MRVLVHFPLSPFCRKVRIALKEKGVAFELQAEKYWERSEDFLALNPAGEVPVLIEDENPPIPDSQVIVEYLEELVPDPSLITGGAEERAEARRLAAWFDQKFYREVTDYLLTEKLLKRFMGMGAPDSAVIRAGRENLAVHMDYVGWLIERRAWLAGERFGIADIAAAAQLSTLDYLGDVPWDDHAAARDWYARVKSRPSFRPILGDRIAGLPPPAHYADLDF